MFLRIQMLVMVRLPAVGRVDFAKTVRNSSFSGGAEVEDVRRKTNLAFWLVFLNTFLAKKKVLEEENSTVFVEEPNL